MGFFSRKGEDASPPEDAGLASPGGDDSLPIAGYDRLKPHEITEQLHELSQVQLAGVEEYERGHEARQAVLLKLDYLRRSEPVPGYDAMETDEIVKVLAGSDSELVKAVRAYETKFQHRKAVLDEVARVLPEAPLSADETEAREAKVARVRASMRRPPSV
jgi:hypothetical protein